MSDCPPGHTLDIDGTPQVNNCLNCAGLYDDSDGPEYGPSSLRCSRKPHMENLRGFPFKTPQKCFDLDIAFLIDWKAEAEKHDREWAAQKRAKAARKAEVSDV